MIISATEKRSVQTFLLASSLLLLTGCFGGKKDTDVNKASEHAGIVTDRGELLLSIDGKPVLYAQDFEDQKAMALQSDQRLAMMLQMMPNLEVDMILKSIEAGLILKENVTREKIDQRPDLAKLRRQYHEALDMQLYIKWYQDEHPVTVTEKEAKEFYESRKDKIQGLAISPAGIDILCAQFDKKEEAERFAHKIKDGSKKNFEIAAKEMNITVTPMAINEEGYADEVLKNSVLAAKKFPSKDIVKMNDGSYMVVGIVGKKNAEYHSFDLPEVKQGITRMCMDEKREAAQLAEVERLKNEYNVVADRSYFDKKAEQAANLQKALQHAQTLAMGAQQESADNTTDFEDDQIMFEDKI